MTKKEEKEFLKRIEKAQLNNIFIQEEITPNSYGSDFGSSKERIRNAGVGRFVCKVELL